MSHHLAASLSSSVGNLFLSPLSAWAASSLLPAATTRAVHLLAGPAGSGAVAKTTSPQGLRLYSSSKTLAAAQQFSSHQRRKAGLLASLVAGTANNPGLRNLLQAHEPRRQFTVASYVAAAAPAESGADDVVAKVLSCAASNNTETGVLSQLAECAMGHASELTPEQVRNLCVSFAKLGYFNTQFKSVMADAVIEKLGQYDPALLADTAWAFGEALYYDYDLMTNLHTYLQANADKFDASGLAKMLWTFGRFGYQDQFLMDMMHEIALKLQADCNSKALADVVYAMAQLGWADPRLHTLVAEYAMDNIQDFDSHSLARLAFGLASVGYDDADLYSAITQTAAEDLDNMTPADVSHILWACGEQGHLCNKFMSAVADSYMPSRLESFTPQQLQTAVVAWNKLGFTNPAVAAAAVRLSEVLPHLAPEFPEAETAAADRA